MADPLSATASILALLDTATKVSKYLRAVKDGPQDRLTIQKELSGLVGVLYTLKDHIDNEEREEDFFATVKALNAPHGPLEQFKLSLEWLEQRFEPVKGIKRLSKHVAWPFRQEEAKEVLSRLHRLQDLFNFALLNDHIRISSSTHSTVVQINEQISEVNEKLLEMSLNQGKEREATRSRDILDWLSPLDFRAQQNDLFQECQQGSGQWFLKSEEFRNWETSDSSVLHCRGIPGAGKTFLASTIVNHLSHGSSQDGKAVAYIYCDYQDTVQQTLSNTIGCIIEQFVRPQTTMPPRLDSCYQNHFGNGTRPSIKELQTILHHICAQGPRIYVVVDALDENQDPSAFIEMLADLQHSSIHVLITSRPSITVKYQLQAVKVVDIRAHDEDMTCFLESRMRRLRCIAARPELQALVTKTIVDAADGMFLLARLHFDSLTDRASPKAVKSAVMNIPRGAGALDRVYGSILARIQSQTAHSRDQATKILSWLIFAMRPLKKVELQHALAIEHGTESFDKDNMSHIDDLLAVCHGLVSYDQNSWVVRLAHYTTQDYLRRHQEIHLPNAQRDIAADCLTYLSYENLGSVIYRICEDLPLMTYAARHWGAHAKSAQDEIKDQAKVLFQKQQNLEMIYNIMWGTFDIRGARRHGNIKNIIEGVHLCAMFDLEILLKALVESGVDADLKDFRCRSPLSWAAQSGSVAVIRFLMEQPNVNINSKSTAPKWYSLTRGYTPLAFAARKGHVEVIKILIGRHEIDINVRGEKHETPLSVAAGSGQTEVARLLLSHHSIQVNARDNRGRTPLLLAVWHGQDSTVRMILDRDDANVNVPDDEGRSLLHWAASISRESVISLLLRQNNVEKNSIDMGGRTPLMMAVRNVHFPSHHAQRLLDHPDVDALARDNEGWTALDDCLLNARGSRKNIDLLLGHAKIQAYLQTLVRDDGFVYIEDLKPSTEIEFEFKRFRPVVGYFGSSESPLNESP